MHKGAYDFQNKASETLAEKAERAVKTVYTAGLMFRCGQLSPGGNNVMAASAANAVNAAELAALRQSGDQRQSLLADVLETRQQYDALDYRTEGKAGAVLLQKIYDTVQELKKTGYNPGGEPHRVGYSTSAPRP
jgi:hypothetical protein